jgi:hypothetical protein
MANGPVARVASQRRPSWQAVPKSSSAHFGQMLNRAEQHDIADEAKCKRRRAASRKRRPTRFSLHCVTKQRGNSSPLRVWHVGLRLPPASSAKAPAPSPPPALGVPLIRAARAKPLNTAVTQAHSLAKLSEGFRSSWTPAKMTLLLRARRRIAYGQASEEAPTRGMPRSLRRGSGRAHLAMRQATLLLD